MHGQPHSVTLSLAESQLVKEREPFKGVLTRPEPAVWTCGEWRTLAVRKGFSSRNDLRSLLPLSPAPLEGSLAAGTASSDPPVSAGRVPPAASQRFMAIYDTTAVFLEYRT